MDSPTAALGKPRKASHFDAGQPTTNAQNISYLWLGLSRGSVRVGIFGMEMQSLFAAMTSIADAGERADYTYIFLAGRPRLTEAAATTFWRGAAFFRS